MSQHQDQSFEQHLGDEQRRLSNLLIYPPFQIRQFVWSLGYGLALSFIICFLVHAYLDGVYSNLVHISSLGADTVESLKDEPMRITLQLGMISVLTTLILSAFGFFISHRTAGPIYHFNKTFQKIRAGNIQLRIQLRPSDDLHEVAEEFNRMMDKITQSSSEEKK